MSFGDRLTQLRKENGYNTRNEFAEKLGIPNTTLRNYETGAREPGHTFLKQISELFNVSVDYLLCLTDNKEVLNSFRIRSSEQALIKKYRSLDNHGKEMVDFTLEKEWERSLSIEKAENIINMPERTTLAAAHARTDITPTPEGQVHDNAIMDDDSEWE